MTVPNSELEKKFNDEEEIKYIFEQSNNSKYLIVVFSAFSPENKAPEYNYRNTLDKFDCNKLFILDDKFGAGCYYLGGNRDFSVERSVNKLIKYICGLNDINYEDIIACGTSKGGYAALYFGIKYGFGKIVVGAPQSKLGTFLNMGPKRQLVQLIAGDSSQESLDYLDGLLFNVLEHAEEIPEVFIHVGKGDYHYNEHVLPLIETLEKLGANVELDLGDFSDHNEIYFYQRNLKKKLLEYIGPNGVKGDYPIINELITKVNNVIEVTVHAKGDNILFAWYLYKDGQKINTEWYRSENKVILEITGPGKYRVLSFVRDAYGRMDYDTSDHIYIN